MRVTSERRKAFRIAAECLMFPAFDHCRFRSTQTTCVSTLPSTPKCAARFLSVCCQNRFSWAWPPNDAPSSESGSCVRISTCTWATVCSADSYELNVIQPANICPCGVISVNASSSE